MKRAVAIVIGSALAIGVSGCSYFRFAPPAPALYEETYTAEDLAVDVAAYEAILQLPADTPATFTAAERKRVRDKMLYSVAREIDRAYFEFKNDFFGTKAAVDTGLDVVGIGITSAAAFATGGTSQILAAAATGLAGSRAAFNKNYFKEKTPDVLLGRMDALRADRWSAIYQKALTPDADYSWYQADRDLVAYYQAGTLEEAFQAIIAQSGKEAIAAEERTKAAIQRKYGAILGVTAPASEVEPLKARYTRVMSMESADAQLACARAIIAAFKKAMPDEPINPGVESADPVDDVAYLQGLANEDSRGDVRGALMAAYLTTTDSCGGS